MLELVREYAIAAGIEFAWHTGSVPQPRRRAEIRRFREDPECRLFLSSESGGLGLNLQVAAYREKPGCLASRVEATGCGCAGTVRKVMARRPALGPMAMR